MTTVVICEKANQAADIRKAIGNQFGQVLPAQGHIYTLADPETLRAADPAWTQWGFTVLWPGDYYPLVENNEKPNLAKLRRDITAALRQADKVIVATDCDREGQLIGEEILRANKYRGKAMRAMFTAQDEKSLRIAFDALKPLTAYQALGAAGEARRQSDQVYNLSLTRAVSSAFAGDGVFIGIGRVLTPTMGIVCRRELEIRRFKPVDYFTVTATATTTTGATFAARVDADETMTDRADGRITDRSVADALAAATDGLQTPITVATEHRRSSPPKFPDMPTLQRKAAKRGWSVDKLDTVLQALYDEHKLITYPRAEVRHLPEDHAAVVPDMLAALATMPGYRGLIPGTPQIRTGRSGHFSDKALAGVSHHAIVPNLPALEALGNGLAGSVNGLDADQRWLFDYICKSYIAAVSPDYEYNSTQVSFEVPWRHPATRRDHVATFGATGAVPLKAGWRAVWGMDDQESADDGRGDDDAPGPGAKKAGAGKMAAKGSDEQPLPALQNGSVIVAGPGSIAAKKTEPPTRFDEGDLIAQMQQAWRYVDDEAEREALKSAKGIGTPATRTGILERLTDRHGRRLPLTDKRRDGRREVLIPTEAALELYELLCDVAPELVDVGLTARMEMRLDEIVTGERSGPDVVADIVALVARIIARIEPLAGTRRIGGGTRPPTDKMIQLGERLAREHGVKLPPNYKNDGGALRQFLDEHAAPEGSAHLPSEKQLAYAERLAADAGTAIPPEARASSKALSAWIDAQPGNGPRGATDKQKALIKKLIDEGRIRLDRGDSVETLSGQRAGQLLDKAFGGNGARNDQSRRGRRS